MVLSNNYHNTIMQKIRAYLTATGIFVCRRNCNPYSLAHGVCMNSSYYPRSNSMHSVHEVSSKSPVSFPKRIRPVNSSSLTTCQELWCEILPLWKSNGDLAINFNRCRIRQNIPMWIWCHIYSCKQYYCDIYFILSQSVSE